MVANFFSGVRRGPRVALTCIMKARGNDLTWGVTTPGFSTRASHIAVRIQASFAFSRLLYQHLKVYIHGIGLAAPGIWDAYDFPRLFLLWGPVLLCVGVF